MTKPILASAVWRDERNTYNNTVRVSNLNLSGRARAHGRSAADWRLLTRGASRSRAGRLGLGVTRAHGYSLLTLHYDCTHTDMLRMYTVCVIRLESETQSSLSDCCAELLMRISPPGR